MAPSCRLLIDPPAPGAWNMATDEVLLDSAAAGLATLRFYSWSEATLSLGYFQRHQAVRADARLAALPWLRRTTGGDAIVHHHELTYSLALPAGLPWQPNDRPWMPRMHSVIEETLAGLDVAVAACAGERHLGGVLCFLHHTPGDLILAGSKVVGSAQRKQRGAILQHGSILLGASPFAPDLPGLTGLSGRVVEAEAVRTALVDTFARATGWELAPGPLSDAELALVRQRVVTRYQAVAWNEKR